MKENGSFTAFTPVIIVEYLKKCCKKNDVTYSEFKGFTEINGVKYFLVLNFFANSERDIFYVDLYNFKIFLLNKRLSQ